ncbi:MAG: zeta toxin family protein [Alphaproteobacteria bacterium]
MAIITKEKIIPYADIPPELLIEAAELIEKRLAQASSSSPQPTLIHLCGVPGSGKTTYAKKFITQHTEFCHIHFDGVMESLRGYNQDKEKLGLIQAFSLWELPARAIGYHLFQAMTEHHQSILFDHSAAFRDHITLIQQLKSQGYRVEMHHLDCPPAIACQRVKEREKIIQRHTPEQLIWDRHILLQELIPIYQELVDQWVTISTQ